MPSQAGSYILQPLEPARKLHPTYKLTGEAQVIPDKPTCECRYGPQGWGTVLASNQFHSLCKMQVRSPETRSLTLLQIARGPYCCETDHRTWRILNRPTLSRAA